MKTLLLIDAHALIHRAFHALPPFTSPNGQPVGALYGISNTLIKILREKKPDYIAAAFDRPEPTFRKEMFHDYKAHRPPAADELVQQIIKTHELFKKFKISAFDKIGFEADDVIGTLVDKLKNKKGLKIIILTGDLDTLQLVEDNHVVVQTPKRGTGDAFIYNKGAVFDRYGITPSQLPDYKGLVGDPSDNIPGVPGIGPKTATKLLQEYNSLENLYKKIGEKHKSSEKLIKNKTQAFLSKKLATIRRDVPLKVDLENLRLIPADTKELTRYFTELGFKGLTQRYLELSNNPISQKKASSRTSAETDFIPDVEYAIKHKRTLSSKKIKVAFDWKIIIKNLAEKNISVSDPLFDVKIAGWLLDPDQKDFSIKTLKEKFLYKKEKEENYTTTLSELFSFFSQKIEEYELTHLFEYIEMPLIKVLAAMERWGIGANIKTLKSLERRINKELTTLSKKIYKEADETFNINSSQQIAHVLFEKMSIKPLRIKKTPTGLYSTAENVLKTLKDDHPIVDLILEYRESFKIASTFIRPLIESVGFDGRIRTTFLQTGTATGRLASEKPNLQNLPQESKWSGGLRKAIEADKGYSFLTFDYSQLELRIMAHVSGDKKLQDAFLKGLDVHKITASQIFNVPQEKVSESMRRVGKTLNFGVIYGMGTRAFSETSGLSLDRARGFIEEYFKNFPDVKRWQEKTKAEAKTFGYVKNQNGRRRWFFAPNPKPEHAGSEISKSVWSNKSYETERAAVNMPIQSLGADISKLAMIKSFEILKERGWLGKRAKLVLAIHDELIFEVSNGILTEAASVIRNIVENVYELSVPLRVEVKGGKNLGSLKKIK